MLSLKIYKSFKTHYSVFTLDIDFSIATKYKRIVFFGPSGSGKTLTMQCIAGLARPRKGRIIINDQVYFDSAAKINVPPSKRHIGYMFQDYALIPHLNVLQNVAFATTGFFAWYVGEEQKKRALDMLARLGIEKLAKHKPAELSGGQKQRVALGRALNSRPSLLLLDEPFSALDPLLRLQLRRELVKHLEKFNAPVIIISHDPEDVEFFTEALVLYQKGHAEVILDYHQQRAKFDTAYECLAFLQNQMKERMTK